ncbi:hypothetical protein CKO23_00785 [Thiocystis violacea]|nr:hypothetical protein [Thiocystis violacea]
MRIGEKIALGFGVVVVIFLGVIWHDHRGLQRVLADYRALMEVDGARQSHAFAIESRLNAMRGAEERFLSTREPALAQAALRQGEALLAALDGLARIDAASAASAAELEGLARAFLERFGEIEQAWRTRGLTENQGLQGAFRDAAHEVEARVVQQIPALQTQVLQLRRREKDYLLRGDAEYVSMVEAIALVLRGEISASALGADEQRALVRLVADYERDFHALVEQDRRIAALTAAMDEAAERITPLVEGHLEQASRRLAEMRERIAESSRAQARRNLLIAALATSLGALFATLLTVRIVRPVREMAGLLDQLTHESPRERIPTVADPRDEVMAMAISLNTLADHKATFDHWWRNAMREALALRDHHASNDALEREEAVIELRAAVAAQLAQLHALRGQIEAHSAVVQRIATRIEHPHPSVTREDGTALRHAAERIRDLLTVLDAC